MNKNEIMAAIATAHQQFWNTMKDLPVSEANASAHGKWSVAQHVDHINKCIDRLGKYLSLPGDVIATTFGTSGRKSISPGELKQNFENGLLTKPVASGAFAPDERNDLKPEELVRQGNAALDVMNHASQSWTEEDLDKYLCSHPLLGKLTAREMLYFTELHARHHHESIKKLMK